MEEEYKDKKASLIVFGIFELLGGLFCGLMATVTLIPAMFSLSEISFRQVIAGLMVYVFFAVWLIWMGIGTIRARRWARVLMLAGSWFMLVCGMMAMVMMFYIMPKTLTAPSLPDETVTAVLVGIYIVLAIIYLLFPAIGVLFYGNRNVRATIDHRDPKPSWTEQCPLPVLILALMLTLATTSILMLCFMNFATPFFGTIISGWPGAVVLLCSLGILISLAVGVYKLRLGAWWGALAMLLLGTLSQVITYSRIDIMDYYVAMGYSDRMLLQLNRRGLAINGSTVLLLGAAYKRDTGDFRESPSLEIADRLDSLGAKVTIIEPFVAEGRLDDKYRHYRELTAAHVKESDVVVIATDHSVFDYQMLAETASALFDTRNRITGTVAGDFERL